MKPKFLIPNLTLFKPLSHWPIPWFGLGMVGVFLLAATLRFWGLNRFNTLVFDEVYYAKFGLNYLEGVPFFDAHPPLGKYMISLAIWIGSRLPWESGPQNGFTGVLLSPFSYRWLNAFTGSLLPLVVAAIAYQLSHRRSYALIAGLLTATDGLLLVESRYALINLYLVFFGLLGHWLFLLGLNNWGIKRGACLVLSGLCLGASFAVKWNGLGFLLGIYLVWMAAWALRIAQKPHVLLAKFSQFISKQNASTIVNKTRWLSRSRQAKRQRPGQGPTPLATARKIVRSIKAKTPLQNLTQLNLLHILFYFGIIPAALYRLIWIPHLQINPEYGFWEIHQKIFQFHKEMDNGTSVHPYCSAWYTWPALIRPMVYLFEKTLKIADPVPTYPPLPDNVGKVIYDIHAMGNPLLSWLASAAILLLLLILLHRLWFGIAAAKITANGQIVRFPVPAELWTVFYLVANYAANWLPWMLVTRCTFVYLYMSASVFSFLAIAWLLERWLRSYQPVFRAIGVTAIFLILLALVFWLPVYWGLPLSQADFNIRMWFRSWV